MPFSVRQPQLAHFVVVVLSCLLFSVVPVLAENTCRTKHSLYDLQGSQGLLQHVQAAHLGASYAPQEHSEDADATTKPGRIQVAAMTASQISVIGGGSANKALANPTKAKWPGTCTCTQWSKNPWWQVNFMEPMAITAVELAARSDCCGDRLHHLNITLDHTVCASGVNVGQGETLMVPCVGAALRIRVQMIGEGYLSMCGFAAFGSPAPKKKKKENPCEIIPMYSSDFLQGTYIIEKPGTYVLQEDVVFEPVTPDHLPLPNCTKYSKQKGYWLGFFAAIAITANDVVIDLNGHSIGMSKRFLFHQRFFTVIQLGSKPFLSGQGPPQFAMSDEDPIIANRTEIKNGVLGLSSHMGIHGNLNYGVNIHDVQIRDFETGGIQLNGAEKVTIERCTIGPSLGAPGSYDEVPALATLSQAMLIDSLSQGLGHEHDPAITKLRDSVANFRKDYLNGLSLLQESYFFRDPSTFAGLPDGSAIYGILLHKAGVAIHDFAACTSADFEQLSDDPLTGFRIKNVVIKDLYLKSDEVLKLMHDGKPVLGPAGDVVQVLRLMDNDGKYKPTALSEAQRRLAELKQIAQKAGTSGDELFKMYGSTNIPLWLQEWMKGKLPFKDVASKQKKLSFAAHGDAMSHVSKGVVGMRLEFIRGVELSNITMSGLHNYGVQSPYPPLLPPSMEPKSLEDAVFYKGCDVRAVSVGGGTEADVTKKVVDKSVTIEGLYSLEGVVHNFVDEKNMKKQEADFKKEVFR
mmetsp:Transcript_59228/g.117348  ORF Transcript_59228/g.117348 Transcript_59228/m.117348 type:complete len:745 (+) Transcript_59228:62-2296(+)